MSTVRREVREAEHKFDYLFKRREDFVAQCLQDLAAGRHANGCKCTEMLWEHLQSGTFRPNACSHIVRCALELKSYECEVGDV